jgi:hypothetical protein
VSADVEILPIPSAYLTTPLSKWKTLHKNGSELGG